MAQKQTALFWRALLIDFSRSSRKVENVEPDFEVFCLLAFQLGDLRLYRCLLFGDLFLLFLPEAHANSLIEPVVVEIVQTPLERPVALVQRLYRAFLVCNLLRVISLDFSLYALRLGRCDVLEELEHAKQLLLNFLLGRIFLLGALPVVATVIVHDALLDFGRDSAATLAALEHLSELELVPLEVWCFLACAHGLDFVVCLFRDKRRM